MRTRNIHVGCYGLQIQFHTQIVQTANLAVELYSCVCRALESWRLELFFKSQKDLQEKVVPFLMEHSIKRINITNKVSHYAINSMHTNASL